MNRIVGMSVAASKRRKGTGFLILYRLVAAAMDARYGALVLETTAIWNDAISIYRSRAFEVLSIDGVRNWRAIDPHRRAEAVGIATTRIQPFEVTFDIADCASFHPDEVIHEKPLRSRG